MRTMVRTLIAAALIAVPLLAVGLAQPANAASGSVNVAITSMTPDWAKPGGTVTVQGTISNNTGSPISGIQIALQTSSFPFQTRSGMESYASGNASSGYLADQEVGAGYRLPRVLHTGVTMNWSASFPASDGGYSGFGVYPLAAVAYDSAFNALSVDRTMLPYWPGGNPASPVSLAWIWPLIDDPQQGPCPQTLASNSLASSLTATGRLGGLLSSGLQEASSSQLTWAVDPALLSDAATMAAPYKVGGNAACTGTTGMPASAAAKSWLAQLRTGTAAEPMFVTPYADPDVSALTHAGLDSDLQSAFDLADAVASKSLHRAFGQNGGGTGDGGAPSVAWPAGGTADEGVLTSLANTGNVSTVVLGSDTLPASAGTAVSTTTGVGTTTNVVQADSGLSQLLGSASARSGPGGQFATQQQFLAETAMIVDASPSQKGRSVVVAPPERWNPSARTASALLSMSTSVPWLHPTSLSAVAASAAKSHEQLPGNQVSGSELGTGYMKAVRSVETSLKRYQSLLSAPGGDTTQMLQGALAATESSAWRGREQGAGWTRIFGYATFLEDSLRGVKIIASKKVVLAGASGDLPVSIQNTLTSPIQVRVRAQVPSAGEMSVGKFQDLVTIAAGKIGIVKVPVHSTGILTTTMQLQLVTRNGSPLGNPPQPMTVQVTRYGRALLILIGAALGVLVLTSAARWVRQWLKDTRAGSGGTG